MTYDLGVPGGGEDGEYGRYRGYGETLDQQIDPESYQTAAQVAQAPSSPALVIAPAYVPALESRETMTIEEEKPTVVWPWVVGGVGLVWLLTR